MPNKFKNLQVTGEHLYIKFESKILVKKYKMKNIDEKLKIQMEKPIEASLELGVSVFSFQLLWSSSAAF